MNMGVQKPGLNCLILLKAALNLLEEYYDQAYQKMRTGNVLFKNQTQGLTF